MRKWAFLLAAMVLIPLLPGGEAQSDPPTEPSLSVNLATMDITNPDQEAVEFTVVASDDKRVFSVDVILINGGSSESFLLPLKRMNPLPPPTGPDPNSAWEAALDRTDVRLTLGEWHLYAIAYDADGGQSISDLQNPLILEVEASDIQPPEPIVRLFGFPAGPVPAQFLSASDFLRFEVESNITKQVTYRLDLDGVAGPEFPLPAPYILHPASFFEGLQQLTVRVYDRAGSSAALSLQVTLDSEPTVLDVMIPQRLFAGVPFEVNVTSADLTNHELTVRIRDEVQSADVPAGGESTFFAFLFNETGTADLVVEARDRVGNQVQTTLGRAIEPAFTELAVNGTRVLDKWVLPGETVRFEADVQQLDGVIAMPVTLEYAAGPTSGSAATDVPVGETRTVPFNGVFQPGRHALQVDLVVPAAVALADNSTTSIEIPFEVFLGKTVHGDDEYFIRTDARGLPERAIPKDTNRSLALNLVQQDGRSVYEFMDGDLTLFWDPLQTVTTIPVPEPEVDTPAMGPLAILALLGVAAFLARRRTH